MNIKGYLKLTVGLLALVASLMPSYASGAKLREDTLEAWQRYRGLTEARIEKELGASDGFLVHDYMSASDAASVRQALASGEIFIKKMQTLNEEGGEVRIPKGLIHHWYGSALVPGASLDDVLAWVQDYDNHADYFDEVEESKLISRNGEVFDVFLRLRRKKVITVHYNTEHRVTYERRSHDEAVSRSTSTRIAEIDHPGTNREREKPVENDRGFLWRLSSYWRFRQTPEGVIVECESIGLSRTIPVAFRWVVQPFITSVPRDSLLATLEPLRDAFRGRGKGALRLETGRTGASIAEATCSPSSPHHPSPQAPSAGASRYETRLPWNFEQLHPFARRVGRVAPEAHGLARTQPATPLLEVSLPTRRDISEVELDDGALLRLFGALARDAIEKGPKTYDEQHRHTCRHPSELTKLLHEVCDRRHRFATIVLHDRHPILVVFEADEGGEMSASTAQGIPIGLHQSAFARYECLHVIKVKEDVSLQRKAAGAFGGTGMAYKLAAIQKNRETARTT